MLKRLFPAIRDCFTKTGDQGVRELAAHRTLDDQVQSAPLSQHLYVKDDSIYLRCWSGERVHILNPQLHEIRIDDIAHGLAHTCRFGGQTPFFYSVAQHSLLVADMVDPRLQLWALLHDASEAYLNDITRPLKRSLPGYAGIETRMMAAICERFNLPLEMPLEIKRADNKMIAAEFRDLFGDAPEDYLNWSDGFFAAKVRVVPCAPDVAKHEFLLRFEELMARRAA